MGTMPEWVHEPTGSEAVEDRVGLESPPVVALDIGGTKLAVGVLSADGTLRSFLSEPTWREQGPERALRRLFDMGHRALAEAGVA
jgi:glucokinase